MKKGITKRVLALVLALAMVLTGSIAGDLASAASAPKMKTKSVTVLVGKAKKLKISGATKTTAIAYSSANKKVAKVSAAGKVTGVKKGKTTVTAKVNKNGKVYNLKSKITVCKGAKKLAFVDASKKAIKTLTMEEGEELKLSIKQTPKSANDVITYTSSDKDIIEVTKKGGVATAFVAGKATITAKSLSGKKVKLAVTVVEEKMEASKAPSTSPAASTAASASPAASTSPAASVTPSVAPSVAPSVRPSVAPSASPTRTPAPSESNTPLPAPERVPDGSLVTDDNDAPMTLDADQIAAAIEGKELIFDENYDTWTSLIQGRPGGGQIEFCGTEGNTANNCVCVHSRTQNWHGCAFDTGIVSPMAGGKYYFEAYVMQKSGTYQRLAMKIAATDSTGAIYPWVGCADTQSGEWTLINGIIDIPADVTGAMLYIEVPTSATCEFYVDDVKGYALEPEAPELGSLYEAYEEYFSIGCAVTPAEMKNAKKLAHLKSQYNSITMENEMKPDAILGSSPVLVDKSEAEFPVPDGYNEEKVPKLNFTVVDEALKLAKDNGFKMRAHTLVWYSQTPAWFFKEGYSTSGALVSKDVMTARMENYIKQVMGHIQNNPNGDVVYCWDVVNEAFTNNGGGLRGSVSSANESSNWYSIYGSNEFIIKAFTYAKKYRSSDAIKLFYNDYNEYMGDKVNDICNLIDVLNADPANKLIDGVGMQSHYAITYPTAANVESAIDRFAAKGVEIQLTEVDCTIESTSDFDRQATFYGDLFEMLVRKKDEGVKITNVTLWGIDDSASWRSSQLPLIFSAGYVPKPAYDSILAVVGAYRPGQEPDET